MPKIQQLAPEYLGPNRDLPPFGYEHGEIPMDDPPRRDYPLESYSAWRATAIYDVGTFTTLLRR